MLKTNPQIQKAHRWALQSSVKDHWGNLQTGPCFKTKTHNPISLPPTPQGIEDQPAYIVKEILNSCCKGTSRGWPRKDSAPRVSPSQGLFCHLSTRFSHGLNFPDSINSIALLLIWTVLPVFYCHYNVRTHLITDHTCWSHLDSIIHTPVNNPDSSIHNGNSCSEFIHNNTKRFHFVCTLFFYVVLFSCFF